jgi:hypothetical protein
VDLDDCVNRGVRDAYASLSLLRMSTDVGEGGGKVFFSRDKRISVVPARQTGMATNYTLPQ